MLAFILVLGAVAVVNGNSFGTVVSCEDASRCLWVGQDGAHVDSISISNELCRIFKSNGCTDQHRRNLQNRIKYISDIYLHAKSMDHKLSYSIGLNERHLDDERPPTSSVRELVSFDMVAKKNAIFSNAGVHRNLATIQTSLNWCDSSEGANPKGRSVCAPVKSQQSCGSCWAFAAADSIETAVSISSSKTPMALSPQQLLDCSRNQMAQTFKYCWFNGAVTGSSWMRNEIRWTSHNNGCEGGMTHAAFEYAALSQSGLASELEIPYKESQGKAQINTCSAKSNSSASISGWKQAVGTDCSQSKDVNTLLKMALQSQPLAVAINSQGTFKDYKSGIYKCPNDGNFAKHDLIDHALVLVGYGTDSVEGDYWILKNSYGPSWGEKGFMKLKADNKINCGVSIYPVMPTGAAIGTASSKLDGGGTFSFGGLSSDAWIVIAVVASLATVVFAIAGIVYSRRMKAKESAYRGGM